MRIRSVPWLILACAACQDPPDHSSSPSAGEPTIPGAADPGARTVARLNRAEYNNAIRDVFGSAKTPADVFPMDERANGFDNQGAALTTTSTHVELWELAADSVLAEMFGRKDETTIRYGIQVEDAGITYEGLGLPYDVTGITFATGASTALTQYSFIGVNQDHHTLSHSQAQSEDDKADLMKIVNWQVAMWTALCEKLAAVPEGDGDLLSNSLVNLISEFGQSNTHTASPMVLLVAGGESAGLVQGHHRSYGFDPHSNLWWTELEYLGSDPSGFGNYATYAFDLTIA